MLQLRVTFFIISNIILLLSSQQIESFSSTPYTRSKFFERSTVLKETKSESNETPVKRIGIIGTGIAGLSLAHALENVNQNDADPFEIHLFDSRKSMSVKDGAGIQMNGGMSVLHKINPSLQKKVADSALPLTKIRSRATPWSPLSFVSSLIYSKGSKNNNNDDFSTLLEFDIEQLIRKAGGEIEKELMISSNVMSYAIMRGTLQQILLDELSESTSKNVNFGKSLMNVLPNESEGQRGIICQFDDGSISGPFDLVVGCDGIQSTVKEYVEKGKISNKKDRKKRSSAIYSGIRVIFAVQDGKTKTENDPKSAELRQYFGDGAYGLSGMYGAGSEQAPSRAAFLIFRDENYFGPFRKSVDNKNRKENVSNVNEAKERNIETAVDENADWTQNVRSNQADPKADFIERMQKTSMPSAELTQIVQDADRFFELGVYFHNPLSINGWKREVKKSGGKFCVLAGDAARKFYNYIFLNLSFQ